VNLDLGLPNPFFSLNCSNWDSNGFQMTKDESEIINNGFVLTTNNYIDI